MVGSSLLVDAFNIELAENTLANNSALSLEDVTIKP